MDNRGLQYIQQILEEGSFSAAAEKLYISQPSLSMYIKRIERELGVEIIDRSAPRLALTKEGEIYLNAEQQIAAIQRTCRQQLQSSKSLKSGHLVIGSTFFRSSYSLTRVLPVFKTRYPGISIQLEESTTYELEQYAMDGITDLSLVLLPLKHPDLIYENLFSEKVLFAISAGSPIVQAHTRDTGIQYPELSITDLKDEPFITMKKGQHLRETFNTVCKIGGCTPHTILETSSLPTAHHLAAIGLGIAIVPDTFAKTRELLPPPAYYSIKEYPQERNVVIAYSKRKKLSYAAQAFIDVSKECLG